MTAEATHMRQPVARCGLEAVAELIKTRHPTFQFGKRSRIAL